MFPENCPKCSTKLLNVPGIGPFCPNKACDVRDNILGVELVFKQPLDENYIKGVEDAIAIIKERGIKIEGAINPNITIKEIRKRLLDGK